MYRSKITGENKERLEELHGKVLASVEGATGLNEDKGILVAPIVKENSDGNSYFTMAVGADNDMNIETSVDMDAMNVSEFMVNSDKDDIPDQETAENLQ